MSDQVALVTGSSRGIGRGIALALAGRGWHIVINYRGNRQAAEETGAAVEAYGVTGYLIQGDVAEKADRERLVDETLERFGRREG